MRALFSLVHRNHKVFRRDKMQVVFSFLSVIIVIVLYAVFLQQVQVDAIAQVITPTPAIEQMVNEWLVAGLLSMVAVTSTLGALGLAVQDLESKATADFLTAPISRAKIQLSYIVNAFIVGLVFSLIALIGCELFLVATGGELLGIHELLKVLGIIVLSVLLASVFNTFLVLFVTTLNAFSTLSTIVGTVLGFLCAVYVPLGVLPNFAQYLVMYFPISHTTLLLREVFMHDSIQTVFAGAPTEELEAYKLNFGVAYDMHGQELSSSTSLIVIIVSIIVFALLSIALFKKKNK